MEKGIPPLYHSYDSYIEQVAENMDSSAWRTHTPARETAEDSTNAAMFEVNKQTSHYAINNESTTLEPSSAGAILHDAQIIKNHHIGKYDSDEIHLGHDFESIDIHSVQPLSLDAQNPTSTFLIEASIPCVVSDDERHYFRTTHDYDVASTKCDARLPGGAESQYDDMCKGYRQAAPQAKSITSSPSLSDLMEDVIEGRATINEQNQEHPATRDSIPADEINASGARVQSSADTEESMKLNQEIQFLRSGSYSTVHQHQGSPAVDERFKDLIKRLRPQEHIEHDAATDAVLRDPAIKRIGRAGPYRGNQRGPFDSSYTSSIAFQPDTRSPSLAANNTSGSSEPGQPPQRSFHDGRSGPPFKNSSLNPAAREFSSNQTHNISPSRYSAMPRPTAFSRPIVPELGMMQRFAFLGGVASSEEAASLPYSSHPGDHSFPGLGHQLMEPEMFPNVPGILPALAPYNGLAMPAMPATNPPSLAPVLPSLPRFPPGIAQPAGLSMSGIAKPVSLTNSGLSSLAGPFHQQLPFAISCNNPSHQAMAIPGPQILAPTSTLSTSAQNLAMRLHTGATHFIPRHVPKPRVPDSDQQQDWELMHELRRTHEPGYAQKCKEKQRKRFIKQLRGSQD